MRGKKGGKLDINFALQTVTEAKTEVRQILKKWERFEAGAILNTKFNRLEYYKEALYEILHHNM